MIIDIVEQINQSDLPPATKVNALALLALAHHDNGHVAIAWLDLVAAFGRISVGRARKHLGLMRAINLIHYSTDSDDEIVYINFKKWPRAHARKTATEEPKNDHKMDEKRAPTRVPAADEDDDNLTARAHARKTATKETKNDHGARENGADLYAHAQAVSLLAPTLSPNGKEPTNPPQQETQQEPWEESLSKRLLTDKRVAMAPKIAERLAAANAFADVRDAVAHWWSNRHAVGGKFEDYPGIVIHWLDHQDDFTIPAADATWRNSDLGYDYRTPYEIAEEEAAERDEEARLAELEVLQPLFSPAPAPVSASPPEPNTPAAYWAQLQSELAIEQGGSFDRWVHDTWVIAYEDGEFLIGLPDAFRYDWIVHRLSRQIKRKLAVIMGRETVEVKFRVQPRRTGVINEQANDATG